jgi:hypothetical protein
VAARADDIMAVASMKDVTSETADQREEQSRE